MSYSSFKLTLHMKLLTDSKPFSHFITILSAKKWTILPILCQKIHDSMVGSII